jgi:hypothetical protein
MDREREAEGHYAIHLKGPGERDGRRGLWWDWSIDYSETVLRLDAWVPDRGAPAAPTPEAASPDETAD